VPTNTFPDTVDDAVEPASKILPAVLVLLAKLYDDH